MKVGDKRHRLPAKNCWWFALDATPSCPHGKSRYLGAPYRIWKARRALERNYDAWLDKFALGHGVLKAPSQYPPLWKNSQSGYADSNLDGTPADPLEDGERLLAELRSGGVAVLPSETDDHGAPLWSYEPPSICQDAGPLERRQALLDAYALRSLGIPERAVTQDASTGSYAMAEVHWRVLLSTCEGVLSQMASSFQRQVVQRLEAVNAPPNRRWNLKLVWQKLDPALSALAMDLVKSILQSPKPSPLVLHGVVDLAKLLEIVRLPTGDRLVERLAKALQGPDDQGSGNSEAPRGTFSLQLGQVKAPRGGISVRGKFYRGGEYIPGDEVSAAATQDRRQLFERVQEDVEEDARDKAAPSPELDPAEDEPNRPDPRDKVKRTTVVTEGGRVDLAFWDGWSWWANTLSRHTVGTIDPRDGQINANVGGKVFVLDPEELKTAVANHEIRSREDFEVWAATHCKYDLRAEADRKLWETIRDGELHPGSMSAATDPLRQVLDQAKDAGPTVEQMLSETVERVLRRNLAPVDAAMTLFEAAKFAKEHGKESAAAALVALGTYLIYRKVSGAAKLRKIQKEPLGVAPQGAAKPSAAPPLNENLPKKDSPGLENSWKSETPKTLKPGRAEAGPKPTARPPEVSGGARPKGEEAPKIPEAAPQGRPSKVKEPSESPKKPGKGETPSGATPPTSEPSVGETRPQPPYEPRQTRKMLDDRFPGKVTSTTIPKDSAANVKHSLTPHPETRIPIDARGLPVFDHVAAAETRLPKSVWQAKDKNFHMRQATLQLRDDIKAGRIPASKFTDEQLAAIRAGEEKIPGFTWHHHQDKGRMQLVPSDLHRRTGHTGGFKLWHGD